MTTVVCWDCTDSGVIVHLGEDIGFIVRSETNVSVYQVTTAEGVVCYEGDFEDHGIRAAIFGAELVA